MKSAPGLKVANKPAAGIFVMAPMIDGTKFNNKLVRQALVYAIDREGIVKQVFFASSQRPAVPGGGHVCFAATGIPAVKAAWEGGCASGGSDDGAPGGRPQYGPAYYSAYLLDPDGYRIEVAVSAN